jgi:two-component system NtrC family sensor kinase
MAAPNYLERRIVREITARKEAERLLEAKSEELYEKNQQLEASSQRLAQTLELLHSVMGVVPEILITCNEDCVIEMVNDLSADQLGYQPMELVGAHITLLIPDMPAAEIEHATKEAFVLSDIRVRKRDGTWIDTEVHVTVINAQGQKYFALVIQNTAARKAAEKLKEDIYWQLHEARRLEAMGALSGAIAHELNTPIQFISDNIVFLDRVMNKIRESCPRYGGADMTCDRLMHDVCGPGNPATCPRTASFPQLMDEILAALHETREGVDYVRSIVGLVKEFSHPGTGEPQSASINTIIQNALSICRFRFRSLSVETGLMDAPPLVLCYPSQIQQVLINLVVNAVEAIEESGCTDGRILITTRVSDGWLHIEVSDNGPGIKDCARQRIFDPFYTTKEVGKGTGQGLALARDIVEGKHGGRLLLGERRGFATTFVVELPLRTAPQKPATRMAEHVPV